MRLLLISIFFTVRLVCGQDTLFSLEKQCKVRSEEISSKFQDTLIHVMFKAKTNATHDRYFESSFHYNGNNQISDCSICGWDLTFDTNYRFLYAKLAYFNRHTGLPNFCAIDKFILDYKTYLEFQVDTVIPNPEDYPGNVYFIDSIVTSHVVTYPIKIFKEGRVVALLEKKLQRILDPKAISKDQITYLVENLGRIHKKYNQLELQL